MIRTDRKNSVGSYIKAETMKDRPLLLIALVAVITAVVVVIVLQYLDHDSPTVIGGGIAGGIAGGVSASLLKRKQE